MWRFSRLFRKPWKPEWSEFLLTFSPLSTLNSPLYCTYIPNAGTNNTSSSKSGAQKMVLSNRSSMPPWPGSRLE